MACALVVGTGEAAWSEPPHAVPPRVVLVLDASGSMWGPLAGRAKIDVARGAIDELVRGWDPRVALGLTVYGHRERWSCQDIEALVPMGALEAEELMSAARAIRPRGMTPIGASLAHAARQLEHRKRAGTVVLVSDGEETCDVDPCEVARRLETEGVDFTVHVVGFGLAESESRQLRCIARATGGLFLAAADAPTLQSALSRALRDARRPAAPAARAPAAGQSGALALSASLAPGGPVLREPLEWQLFALDERGGRAERLVHAQRPTLLHRAAPGAVRASVRLGLATASLDLAIEPSTTATRRLVLGAGVVRVHASLPPPGGAIRERLHWRVSPLGSGDVGPAAELESAAHTFVLPAGRYRVEAEHGALRGAREIGLQAGQQASLEVVLR